MGKFTYTVSNPNIQPVEINAPDGWSEDESQFPRSDTYKGIFRKFSANELTFKGVAAEVLRTINAQLEFESEGTFKIEEEDFQTYSDFVRFIGAFDFVKFKEIDGNEGRSVTITVIDSSFWNTIKNRENIKPQLSKLESLDGFQISGFTNEEQFITVPRTPTIDSGSVVADVIQVATGNHSVPLVFSESEDDNLITVADYNITDGITGAFYVSDGVSSIDFNIEYETSFLMPSGNPVAELLIKRYNSSNGLVSSESLASITGALDEIKSLEFSGTRTFTPNDGDYFILSVESTSATEGFESQIPYIATVESLATVGDLPEIQVSGMLLHEFFSRILQIYTGTDKPFYSELVGGVDSEPRSYISDGDYRNILVTNGERIRGFSKDESPITAAFKSSFNSLFALTPIGIGIETIEGVGTVRLERLRYFFDDRVVLTIENASNVEKTTLTDKIFNKIVVGYKKALYEERKGLNEVNQKSEFSTPISVVQNDYNIVSEIRADSSAINAAREKSKANFPTEDTRYDTDNFFFTLIKNESLLLNGDFESWTDDNTPDEWTIQNGTVLKKNLLGSYRCYYESVVTGNVSVLQTVAVVLGDKVEFKLSYENIGTGTIDGFIAVSLTDGVDTYYLTSDGSWVLSILSLIYFATNLINTDENLLQSFKSFSLLADNAPIPGDMSCFIVGGVGLIIDDIYLGKSKYIAKTTEGFNTYENLPFGEHTFNLDITPTRNFKEHGSEIRAGLANRLSQYVRANNSSKNSTAITQKDTESSPTIENADIQVNDLAEPYLKPKKHVFDLVVDKDVIDVLNETFPGETKRKYLGMVRYRKRDTEDYTYVWLLDTNTGGESGLGKITGVEVDLDYVTPVII